jgi:hypothetical protein
VCHKDEVYARNMFGSLTGKIEDDPLSPSTAQ